MYSSINYLEGGSGGQGHCNSERADVDPAVKKTLMVGAPPKVFFYIICSVVVIDIYLRTA